jgi:hypothetical protein
MSKLVPNTPVVRGILRRLRPPCARSIGLRFPYTLAQRVNPGITVAFPANESAVACGSGKVVAVQPVQPFWAYSADSPHATKNSYQVVIDHGGEVRTVVHGMSSVVVRSGQQVSRGDVLGTPLTTEVFMAVLFNGNAYDPQTINRHFKAQNGNIVVGQGGLLRYAPDLKIRDLSDGIVSTLVNGYRYFVAATCAKPDFLVNVDFDGSGQKVGLAATGIATTDYWNVYTPVAFTETEVVPADYFGCAGSEFSINPVVFLQNYDGQTSTVRLERVSPMTTDSGGQTRFDAMLSTWIGNDDPVENTFKVKGIPAGTYRLYLYAGDVGALSEFYVSVNNGGPTTYSITPTLNLAFVQNNNYIIHEFVLSAYDVVTVKCVGPWSGMQIERQ